MLLLEATQQFLLGLYDGPRRTLLKRLCAGRAGKPTPEMVARLLAAVLTPDGEAKMLEGLSEQTLGFLDRSVLRGDRASSRPGDGPDTTPEVLALWEIDRSVAELRDRGLLRDRLTGYGSIEIFPPLATLRLLSAIDRHLAPLDDPAPRPPLAFRLAVAGAIFAADEVPLTQSGTVHAGATGRLSRRLETSAPWVRDLPLCAPMLQRVGVLRAVTIGERVVLRLDPAAAAVALSLPPRDLGMAGLPTGNGAFPHARVLAHVRALAASSPQGTVTIMALLDTPLPEPTSWADSFSNLDSLQFLHLLLDLAFHELVELAGGDGPDRTFRETSPAAAPATTPFVVQPSLDVLVPWDASPSAVVQLAAIADLEAADRVCRFQLTRASVTRGVALLGSREAVVRVLEAGSGRPLAQNVRATLAGWTDQAHTLRPAHGDVLVADTEPLQALVRQACPDARLLAPGVFLVSRDGLSAALKRAKAEGLTIAPTERVDGTSSRDPTDGGGSDRRGSSRADPATRAAAFAKVVTARVADAQAKRAPPSTSRRRRGAAAATGTSHAAATRPDASILRLPVPPRPGASSDEPLDDDDAPLRAPPTIPLRRATPPPVNLPSEWSTPLPGVLRQQLELAAAGGVQIALMYVNSRQVPVEMLVMPTGLRPVGHTTYLDARDLQKHNDVALSLDRITSIRAPAPQG